MSTKDNCMGMDREIQAKIQGKYDADKHAQAQAWIEELSGTAFPGPSQNDFKEHLKSGVVLCNTLNVIKPGTVKKIHKSSMPFMQRENITSYLDGCKSLGMVETDLFVTQDLYEGDNLILVIDNIHCLGGLARKIGYEGPTIGVKFADANKREFSAEVIAAGKAIVPQQSAGSVAVDKGAGVDAIVMYGKLGQEMGKASSEMSQQTGGSIAVEKNKGTDHIVKYGNVGQEMGQCSSEPSMQNAGAVEVDKGKKLDNLTRGHI